jgi:CAAX protease family protein
VTPSSPTRRSWGPLTGRVAEPEPGGSGMSTGPRAGSTAGPTTAGGIWAGGVVLAGGLSFLLARPALGGMAFAVPLLALGYLAMAAGSLAVGLPGTSVERVGRAPLGWGPVLAVGVVAVALAGVVGGPVPERRVGAVAAGLAVVAAVAEEALFRRLLYGWLERFGTVVAVVGSAVVFALVHLPGYGIAAMPVDLGAAMLLSWQRYACGRWTVPAVTHAVANLLAVT